MLTINQQACLLALHDYGIHSVITGDAALCFYGWPGTPEDLIVESSATPALVARFAAEKTELFISSGLMIAPLDDWLGPNRRFAIKYETIEGRVEGKYVWVISPLDLLRNLTHETREGVLLRVRFLADVIEREQG